MYTRAAEIPLLNPKYIHDRKKSERVGLRKTYHLFRKKSMMNMPLKRIRLFQICLFRFPKLMNDKRLHTSMNPGHPMSIKRQKPVLQAVLKFSRRKSVINQAVKPAEDFVKGTDRRLGTACLHNGKKKSVRRVDVEKCIDEVVKNPFAFCFFKVPVCLD